MEVGEDGAVKNVLTRKLSVLAEDKLGLGALASDLISALPITGRAVSLREEGIVVVEAEEDDFEALELSQYEGDTCIEAGHDNLLQEAGSDNYSFEILSDAMIPSSDAMIPSSGAMIPSSGAMIPSSDAMIPSSGAMIPSSDAMIPSSGAMIPSSGAMIPSSGAMIPSSGAMIPSSDAMISPSDAMVPSSGATSDAMTTPMITSNTSYEIAIHQLNVTENDFTWN